MSQTLVAQRAAQGATALRGGRSWRPTPYQVFGFLFWLLMSLAYWRLPLCCDAGQHAAVVERLKANLLDPRHPMADLPGRGSPYYSPYAVAQGAFARLTGLGGWAVVKLAGPLNLLVLLTGIGRFTRMLTPRPWAPVLALAAMTLLWGTERAWWSGYLGLMSMTGNLGYPSAFAIGLTFWAWGLTGARARNAGAVRFVGPSGLPGLGGYMGLGVLYGLILLIHPITALGAALGAAALIAPPKGRGAVLDMRLPPRGRDQPPLPRRYMLTRWTLLAATALLISATWPYFDIFTLVGDARVDAMHHRLYLNLDDQFWLALLGLPALWLRAYRTSWRDPLVLLFALDCLALAYGWFSGHYTYGRILGLTLVPLQFALAVELAAPRPWPSWRKALGTVAAVGACVGFLTVQAGAVVPRTLDPVGFEQPPRWPTYAWAAQHIGPGEVVIADGYHAVHAIAGHGPNLAAPAWPDAALDEGERRRRLADVRAYLSPGSTRAERSAVVRRYHVRWLLLTRWRTVPEEAVVVAWSPRTGEVLARVPSGVTRR
ncbi:hypothetical protein AB0I00_40275 [Streptomyces sp. NPDC050803]|uniref:hypothetical protein n=1 Tax=unclassified Streptomyces TaxID=2593676 RepID=UPI00342945B0